MATATNTAFQPCFNRAAIMQRAWELYRRSFQSAFNRKGFAWALKAAWRDAELDQHFAKQEAQRAAMTAHERRVSDVRAEIEHLDRLPLAQRIGDRRAALTAELQTLRRAA